MTVRELREILANEEFQDDTLVVFAEDGRRFDIAMFRGEPLICTYKWPQDTTVLLFELEEEEE